MNKRYAPIGLIIAALAALTAFGLYFVQREWNLPLQISIALVVIGLAAFVILDPDRTRNMLSGRQARYGSNAFVLALAFFGIIIVINILVYQNATDWKLRWDWTENKENTLAPETIDILTAMPEKVLARAYYSNAAGEANAKDLLEDFKFYGSGNFDYEFINPDENPVAAQQDGYTRDGVILVMGENKETLATVTELELASGLVRLLNPDKQKVYFLIGHGEFNFEETGDTSLNQLKLALEDRNYTPETLNLLATKAIPEDAKVLFIAGPNQPLSAEEVNLIRTYVDGGGSLIVLYEPVAVTQFGNEPDPLTDYLQEVWGITMQNDIVIDASIQDQPFIAVSNEIENHPITQKFQSLTAIFPTARSVRATTEVDGISKTELIRTIPFPNSWAETDIASINAGQPTPDEATDILGPVPLAVAASNATTSARVVVIGDAEFVTNQGYSAYGNGDFILNSVSWAADQEDVISLTPKDVTQRTLELPPQTYILNLILFGVVIVLPGLMLVAGAVVWFQRRRRA